MYGPHIAILYASRAAQARLGSLGHYFHAGASLETKLGLAASSYELVASVPRVVAYFGDSQRAREGKWEAIASHEERLQEILLDRLAAKGDAVRVLGWPEADKAKRVPVVSFVVQGRSSKEIVEGVESRSNFGCRWGHFYSKRMVDDLLGLEGCDGVVRVSLVHYNTEEEVGRFVEVLEEVLQEKAAGK